MDDVPRFSLGDALEQMVQQSLADWRQTYAAHMRVDDLLGESVTHTDLRADLLPRGVVDVTVTIFGRRRFENEVYFAKLLRQEGVYRFL